MGAEFTSKFVVRMSDVPPADGGVRPKKAKQKRSYNVKVVYDPTAETYTASWGTDPNMVTSAPSMPTALRLLANVMDGLHMHGTSRDILHELRYAPAILCKYCNGPIFFARLPSGKFLSFEPTPIDASEVQGVRVATFTAIVDSRQRPNVLWPSRPEGPVWIPHPEVCGTKTDAPENEALRARWEARRPGAIRERDNIIAGLREIRRDFGEEYDNTPGLSG